jgi:hypothetical protein
MKAVRLYSPSISFLVLGLILLVVGTISVIRINLGGTIENIFWFVDGALAFCIFMQIGMRFAKECTCDVFVSGDEQ